MLFGMTWKDLNEFSIKKEETIQLLLMIRGFVSIVSRIQKRTWFNAQIASSGPTKNAPVRRAQDSCTKFVISE